MESSVGIEHGYYYNIGRTRMVECADFGYDNVLRVA